MSKDQPTAEEAVARLKSLATSYSVFELSKRQLCDQAADLIAAQALRISDLFEMTRSTQRLLESAKDELVASAKLNERLTAELAQAKADSAQRETIIGQIEGALTVLMASDGQNLACDYWSKEYGHRTADIQDWCEEQLNKIDAAKAATP